jgi:hypothetical protein
VATPQPYLDRRDQDHQPRPPLLIPVIPTEATRLFPPRCMCAGSRSGGTVATPQPNRGRRDQTTNHNRQRFPRPTAAALLILCVHPLNLRNLPNPANRQSRPLAPSLSDLPNRPSLTEKPSGSTTKPVPFQLDPRLNQRTFVAQSTTALTPGTGFKRFIIEAKHVDTNSPPRRSDLSGASYATRVTANRHA